MLFCAALAPAAAARPIELPAQGAPSVGLPAGADAAPGTASFEDIRAGRIRFVPFAQFQPRGWPVSLWLRFSVTTALTHDRPNWMLTIPRTFESARLYRADGTSQTTGMYVPFSARPEGLYVPSFRISDRDVAARAPLYLNVVYYPEIPLSLRLTTERTFFLWNEPYRVIEGLFLGVLFAVAFFNLFVFGAMRDRSALLYVAYIVVMIVNEIVATGLGEAYLWPNAGLDVRLLMYIASFASFTVFLFFERSFLQTREEAPACDRALLIAYGVYAVTQIAQALIPGGNALVPFLLLTQLGGMVVTIAVAVVRLRSGYGPARFFVLAFAPATIGIFANLWYDAFLPAGNWFWASNGVEFGTMLQSIVLSFSVVDRLRLLQHESKRTRTELTVVSAHAKKMQTLALFDPLTGLSNRVRFTDELNRAIARRQADGRSCAVLFCDLDGFKSINDLFGHRFGDEVLRVVSNRLSKSLRGQDLIARLGGDEFAVLLDYVPSSAQADHVAGMLSHLLDEPIVLEGKIMPIGISVGRAVYPEDGLTMDDLLHVADLRMYEMKQARKVC